MGMVLDAVGCCGMLWDAVYAVGAVYAVLHSILPRRALLPWGNATPSDRKKVLSKFNKFSKAGVGVEGHFLNKGGENPSRSAVGLP